MPIILNWVPRARAYNTINDDARRAAVREEDRRRAVVAGFVHDGVDDDDAFFSPFPLPIVSGSWTYFNLSTVFLDLF
jgi:hypothetical protein